MKRLLLVCLLLVQGNLMCMDEALSNNLDDREYADLLFEGVDQLSNGSNTISDSIISGNQDAFADAQEQNFYHSRGEMFLIQDLGISNLKDLI